MKQQKLFMDILKIIQQIRMKWFSGWTSVKCTLQTGKDG